MVLLLVALRAVAAANLAGREMDLQQNGQAWELNSDQNGHLWISEYGLDEIWQLNPATDVYTIYEKIDGASDARLDTGGDLWWADFNNYGFGRLDLDSGIRTTWPLTGTKQGRPTGLNFDEQGRVWITDREAPELFSYDPQSEEFCHYSLPEQIRSWYVLNRGGYVWLADTARPYILRIDPEGESYTTWYYDDLDSDPRGMTFDDQGNLWWSGYRGQAALFSLYPDNGWLTAYALPDGKGRPAMVAADGRYIWYSDEEGSFGRLDPKAAGGVSAQIMPESDTLQPDCYSDWQPDANPPNEVSSYSASWSAGTYTNTVDAGGWLVYELPDDTPDGSEPVGPWGIRVLENGVWLVDQDRQKLVHIERNRVYVPTVVR